MSRRSGQQGNVVEKGKMWHGRYYVDVVGQDERKRVSVPLGSTDSMTKPEARRKLRTLLEGNGFNTEAHFVRTTRPGRTFAEEAEWWKENRLSLFKPSCQETMGGHTDKYLLPRFGKLSLDSIDERQVQEFIAQLNRTEYRQGKGKRKKLSPKSIRNIIGVLKLVLGGKVWREWKLSLPETPLKEQRYFKPAEMLQIINAATGQWKPLFATLASTGLRAGEAFGLHVEDLDLSEGKIFVRRSIWRGQEVTVKTKQGYRVVSIELALAEMLKQHLNERVSGRVFQTTKGTPFSKDGVRRKLQTILRKLGLEKGGLHAFRHGRVSILQAKGVPGDLVKEWVGHSSLRTTSNYTHFQDEYRQQVVNDVGLLRGNRSENCSVGPNGPNFSTDAAESKVA